MKVITKRFSFLFRLSIHFSNSVDFLYIGRNMKYNKPNFPKLFPIFMSFYDLNYNFHLSCCTLDINVSFCKIFMILGKLEKFSDIYTIWKYNVL